MKRSAVCATTRPLELISILQEADMPMVKPVSFADE